MQNLFLAFPRGSLFEIVHSLFSQRILFQSRSPVDGFTFDLSNGGFLVSFPNRANEGLEKLIEIMGDKFPSKHRSSFGLNDGREDNDFLPVEEQLKYLMKLSQETDVLPQTYKEFNKTLTSMTFDLYYHPLHIFLGNFRNSNDPKYFHKQLLRHEGCDEDISLNQWKSFFSLEWIACVVKMGIAFVLLGREVPKTAGALLEILKDSYPPISVVEEFTSRIFDEVIFLFLIQH